MQHTRRSFLRNSGAAAIVYKVVDGGFQMKAAGPNDKIGLGFVGVGIRGSYLLENFQAVPGVRPVIAADLPLKPVRPVQPAAAPASCSISTACWSNRSTSGKKAGRSDRRPPATPDGHGTPAPRDARPPAWAETPQSSGDPRDARDPPALV